MPPVPLFTNNSSRNKGIVQDYNNPQPGETPTLTLDAPTLASILTQGVARPKGYTVSWHVNPAIEGHHFGPKHPMKPWRLTLTKQLIMAYGMHWAMDTYQSRAATKEEMANFHEADYLDFLQRVTPQTLEQFGSVERFNIGDDCPIFAGLNNYCSLYAGASIDAARKLCSGQSDIAINWSGGLHHAKKGEASGFCYINDIVLAIQQLLLYHPRVLYIDIDVHHGDGVEQAFWSTDRVLTLSLHKYDPEHFFPGTGPLSSCGPSNPLNPGSHHSLNVPLRDGIGDVQYVNLFKAVVTPCVNSYRPTAIVLQCGADSLGSDRIGCFNLNIRAHGECLAFVKSLRLPLLVLGGGGYTPRNVARLWTHETALCLGVELHPSLPAHTPSLGAFDPDRTLYPPLAENSKHVNQNDEMYLDEQVRGVMEHLRWMGGAPGVQMQNVPRDVQGIRDDAEKEVQQMIDAGRGLQLRDRDD
ncbi:MAG: histone deacetylase [Trizodia sp. TS-e1964]|nr:MAG: histone deacetylase [Trizodia sp. TS-e1964]